MNDSYRAYKYIGELPSDYEYKFLKFGSTIKIIGIHDDNPPIAFILEEDKLVKLEIGAGDHE